VVAVAFVEEVASLLLEDDRCPLVVLRREGPTGFEEGLYKGEGFVLCLISRSRGSTYPANELVGRLEPRSEFFIGPSIVFELRDGVEEPIKRTTASKTLEEDTELLPCLLHNRVITEHALGGTPLLLAGSLGGIEVRLERVEEPGDRPLV
jgi:hypothetical protein